MMRLRELFYLNKSDRQVLLMLLSLAAIVLCALYFTGNGLTTDSSPDSLTPSPSPTGEGSSYNRGGDASASQTTTLPHREGVGEGPRELFPFDPNTADSSQLLRLGLSSWQVRNIYKYRAAGGIYRSKEDFAQLYGLTVKQYRELEPYIRISRDYLPASTLFPNSRSKSRVSSSDGGNSDSEDAALRYPVKLREGETIDLNLSDTSALKTIPGIGSYYARRIVDYGQRLGGYVSVEQLDEIEDLPPEAKAFAVVSQPHPRQLAINRLTLNELKRHPYINFYQAKAIIEYRRLHGSISSLSDLRLLPEFTPEVIARLEPYISYE